MGFFIRGIGVILLSFAECGTRRHPSRSEGSKELNPPTRGRLTSADCVTLHQVRHPEVRSYRRQTKYEKADIPLARTRTLENVRK